MERTLVSSSTPEEDIMMVAYEGQDYTRRMYKGGYENFFDEMPVLRSDDPLLDEKVQMSHHIMQRLAGKLRIAPWVREMQPGENGFNRTILALEKPVPVKLNGEDIYKEGAEFVMARWGNGHTSPVHGHAIGYIHEEILFGMMRVNTYRMVDMDKPVVRPVLTTIETAGTFASLYTRPGKYYFKRQTLIHNFTSIGFSTSLHFLSEHTRDGRDNQFEVERFDDMYKLTVDDVTRINSQQGMYLRKGDVVLVRSSNVPEYGDHYIVVTGHPVKKDHGLRVQEKAIYAPDGSKLLDCFEMQQGLTLLKLKDRAKEAFHGFHNISLDKDGDVVWPQATPLMY